MAAPAAEAARPAAPVRTVPPWTRQRAMLIALLVIAVAGLVAGWRYIGMGVTPLFTGIGHIVTFIGQTVPPSFTAFPHTLNLALITVCMAVVGTAMRGNRLVSKASWRGLTGRDLMRPKERSGPWAVCGVGMGAS